MAPRFSRYSGGRINRFSITSPKLCSYWSSTTSPLISHRTAGCGRPAQNRRGTTTAREGHGQNQNEYIQTGRMLFGGHPFQCHRSSICAVAGCMTWVCVHPHHNTCPRFNVEILHWPQNEIIIIFQSFRTRSRVRVEYPWADNYIREEDVGRGGHAQEEAGNYRIMQNVYCSQYILMRAFFEFN